MRPNHLIVAATLAVSAALPSQAGAQHTDHPHLHLTNRWKECSFQLDPALTQVAWHQFAQEAGLVIAFRPLADARPLGRGKLEVAVLQGETAIDDHDAAWNDTFVHPDSNHVLFEGDGLKFPGLMLRAGIAEHTGLGLYFTKNPLANYGVAAGQLQHTLLESEDRAWAAAGRVSVASLFGPEDLSYMVYGAEVVASRRIALTRWADVSPYAGVSAYRGNAHEKSALVNLADEHVMGAQAMVGAVLRLSKVRVAAEYNAATVHSFSIKVGIGQ